jgi:molybdopterin-guanine dinucleotide biosynthesis protein A
MIPKEQLTAVILAGGQSRRMGKNKALLTLHGQTFLERLQAAARPLVQTVALIDNGALADVWTGRVWRDRYTGQGPVAGLETALYHCQTPYILALSCDLPLLSTEVLAYLLAQSQPQQSTIFSLQGRWQPLVGVYAKAQHRCFENALQNEQLRLMRVLQALSLHVCPCPAHWARHLSNINTPTAYQQLLDESNR